MSAPAHSGPEKLGGFDKYDVESAARTLIEAEEIRRKLKFYKVVKKELAKQAQAAQDPMAEAKMPTRNKGRG